MKDYPTLLLEENERLLRINTELKAALGSVVMLCEAHRDYSKMKGDKLLNPNQPPLLFEAKKFL